MSERREFPTEVVLTALSGTVLCKFSDMHEMAEYALGGPVWTHEFASSGWASKQLHVGLAIQHPALAAFDTSGVNRDNWQDYVARAVELFGPTLTVRPIPDAGRHAGPLTTAIEQFSAARDTR